MQYLEHYVCSGIELVLCSLHFNFKITTSNIGASIISLHDTPRLHTLKHVIRIFFIRRTYNETSKLTLGFIHQNPIKNRKFLLPQRHQNNKKKKSDKMRPLMASCFFIVSWFGFIVTLQNLQYISQSKQCKTRNKCEKWLTNH